MLTSNYQQNFIKKIFQVPDSFEEPTKYSKWNTDNNLVFSGPKLGFFNRNLRGKTDNNEATKYRGSDLPYNYEYLRDQLSDKICDSTSGNNINYLNTTTQILGDS